MSIILTTERKNIGTRLIVVLIYCLLSFGALAMIYPFLITVSSSLTNSVEYHRFRPVPRALISREDRFVRGLVNYFRDAIPDVLFSQRPKRWTNWTATGDDLRGIDEFAGGYLRLVDNPERMTIVRRMAADYSSFVMEYDIEDCWCLYDVRDLAGYLQDAYERKYRAVNPETAAQMSGREMKEGALTLLRNEWGVPYREFFDVRLDRELDYPMHHPSWSYPETPKAAAFLRFKDAYRRIEFHTAMKKRWQVFLRERGVRGAVDWPVERSDLETWAIFKEFMASRYPATRAIPFSMKEVWIKYLNRGEAKLALGVDSKRQFDVALYNELFGTRYEYLAEIPFPVPQNSDPRLAGAWDQFILAYYPARLVEVRVSPEIEQRYQAHVESEFKTTANFNRLMTEFDPDFRPITAFSEVKLAARSNLATWKAFIRTLPREALVLHSAEAAFQAYLLSRYGSIGEINAAYDWKIGVIEEARLPFAEAYTITFVENEWRDYLRDVAKNYRQVAEYLFVRGRAFLNTAILVVLTIICTLTVNPLAAYALSRFRLRHKEQVLLFLLATMAFPAAVRAIPGFLLMRDLHLLNSYAALVLPGMANGLSIFILKCFFDGLPRELYEAATIDGAREWQIFLKVTLPLMKPILAVNSLTAFVLAYNSWQWALLVCQDRQFWTLAVWLYQMQDAWAAHPHVIMAGFVLASIPTAIVFVTCQKVILRGIVVPSMK
jgi:ABC-type glycerol-3-phosphate transport system permease component